MRTQVLCVAQHVSADQQPTLHENMIFQGRLYGLAKHLLSEREKKLFELFELEEYASRKAGSCSGSIFYRIYVSPVKRCSLMLDTAIDLMGYLRVAAVMMTLSALAFFVAVRTPKRKTEECLILRSTGKRSD